ncbi:unnamed protein product [Caenorhabditis auriculariae]|uniref:Pyridine nucleotide-disulfide oxidoreductase domain-containing protein 2 n=1 Tax=Caenorhabditis auriculariae TaxID=2777116 RepID=A0A8S1HIB1_9PELO|nr:unnamed protein product [Caenorhabditis auriculariae]
MRYVLLHHVIGGLDEHKGAWGYVFGGMGAVSQAIADCAKSHGAEIRTEQNVEEILLDGGVAKGVRLANGKELHSKVVLANTTPHVTFKDLLPENSLPHEFLRAVGEIDYTSPVTKINVAVKELPNFSCRPTEGNNPSPHHQTTIHMNCESMQLVHQGVLDYRNGEYSKKPVIEMTIPSSVDRTIVEQDGHHVVLLFTQYTPFHLNSGAWTEEKKKEYATHVFSEIDAYAPNFSKSIVGYDILTPPDIQETFGITGGNIFHGSMGLDQLYFNRPISKYSNYSTPIKGLFLCGSGAHPGGGVTGAPGRLGAMRALRNLPTNIDIRQFSLSECCLKNKAGKHKATVNRSQLLTYEMAQKPHHIGVRKSWLTWHSQNLEEFRQQQPVALAQDEVVRRFIRGFFPQNVVVSGNELVIKRRGNLLIVAGFLQYSRRLDIRRIYWMYGFAEEFLSLLLKQPVKLELSFVENEDAIAYNYI